MMLLKQQQMANEQIAMMLKSSGMNPQMSQSMDMGQPRQGPPEPHSQSFYSGNISMEANSNADSSSARQFADPNSSMTNYNQQDYNTRQSLGAASDGHGRSMYGEMEHGRP